MTVPAGPKSNVRAEKKAKLLDVAVKVLCRRSIDGVGKVLAPDGLASASVDGDTRGVSRQTAYRLWPSRGSTVEDLALHVTHPVTSRAAADLELAQTVYGTAERTGQQLTDEEQRRRFLEVLVKNFERQFDANEAVVGLNLHVAAMTSSLLWQGEKPDAADAETGRRVLAARGRAFDEIARMWAGLLSEAMAAYGRRPRAGHDVESIVRLMHCYFSGAWMRFFVDPKLSEPAINEHTRAARLQKAIVEAADVMVELAWAYTEPGPLEDPRCPATAERLGTFVLLVDSAAALYAEGRLAVVRPDEAADAAGVPPEVAWELFAGPVELADSVLRRRVAPAGNAFIAAGMPMVRPVLERLTWAGLTHGPAFAVADDEPDRADGAEPFVVELTNNVARALYEAGTDCDHPAVAADVVARAQAGSWSWNGVLHDLEPGSGSRGS